MKNTVAEFGYNTNLENNGYVAWESMGTKYNFNVTGRVLGIYSVNNKDFLLSQVIDSFGDNCMAGTIDAREVILRDGIIISNNLPSSECMVISRMLSNKATRDALAAGKTLEQTEGFANLAKLGMMLQKQSSNFGEKITVCGVEEAQFESFKNAMNNGKTM